MMTTIRMPAPSERPRKILSPRPTFAPLEGLVEMGSGSGMGEARTSPDPASAGLGSPPASVTSSLSVIGPGSHPHRNRAGAQAKLCNCVDGLQQTLLEGVRQRDVTGGRQVG